MYVDSIDNALTAVVCEGNFIVSPKFDMTSNSASSKRSTSHIPYRNSKLTLLLKDALGGNTTTCIIATVSPENACSHETMCTLSFAQRCRNIDLKAVTANVRISVFENIK